MWLLGNLFLTEKSFGGLSGAPWKIFEITTDIMVSSTENYGILRGTILVAADLSDFFPKSLASPITTVAVRPDASQRSQVAMSELRQKHTASSECSTSALPCEATAIKLNQQS